MSHTHSLSLRISFLGKRHSCKLKNNMTCKYCERQKPRGCGSREEALTLTWRQSRAKGRKEYGMRSFQKKIMSAEGEKEQRCKGVVSDRCRETQAEIRQKALSSLAELSVGEIKQTVFRCPNQQAHGIGEIRTSWLGFKRREKRVQAPSRGSLV